MVRYRITDRAARILRADHAKLNARTRSLVAPQRRPRYSGGGSVTTTTSTINITFVLIEEDVDGIREDDPATEFVTSDVTLTQAEIDAGYTVVLQDPANDDYNVNHQTSLNLFAYQRRKMTVKYYASDDIAVTGAVVQATATTLKLENTASDQDHFYKDGIVSITAGTGSGQTRNITAYVGSTRTLTTDKSWDTNPDTTSEYLVTTAPHQSLAITTIDDTEGKRKVVRYATTVIYYDDGADFKVGTYKKSDYPDYPENEVFPPDGSGTYAEMPLTYFNCKYRGVAINGSLNLRLCKRLPPPPLQQV